ncbi:hypothetical protein F5051DRAFT_397875 [Lentinula edodes]|nr:hypothetical protein F5051DRAFT_397875 [Lentinula edodes]
MTSCIPPNGRELFRTIRPIYSSLSKSLPSIIDISSMIKTSVSVQLNLAWVEFAILEASIAAFSLPRPMPAQECTVDPLILIPAIPVLAVTATSSFLDRRTLMISRKRTDLPVPAGPVKKTLPPALTVSRTCFCSLESLITPT